jgi:hypothetical protein
LAPGGLLGVVDSNGPVGMTGRRSTTPQRKVDQHMLHRIRSRYRTMGNGPWLFASVIGAALIITPMAFAVGEGTPLLGGKRSPSQDARKAYTSETQIIANTSTYGTRQSNKSDNGGGAIYGCRSAPGGTEKGNQPCVRASNLNNGRAFEFDSGGTEVGRITSANKNAAPFTTNATGVATGLNADQVDGKSADEIVAAAQALNKFAAVNGADGKLVAGRGAASSTRNGTGDYSVAFSDDISKCAYTATVIGGAGQLGFASVEPVDAKTLRVRTNDAATSTPAADRTFHLVVTC